MASEILQLGLGSITHLGHREVHFRAPRPEPGVIRLRTADDVFLLAARLPDIGPARTGVDALAELVAVTEVDTLLRHRLGCGGSGELTGVEVSASFLGRRNFNRYDAEDAVGRALARRLGTGYHSRRGGVAPPPDHGAWRLVLDGVRATLMLRITDRPLHRRTYKRCAIPGTLHPPLAAAMVRMADIQPEHRVLDPCCGAGTLLVEAGHLQPDAHLHGFDLDPDALRATRTNAADCRAITVRPADAGDLPLADGGIDRVVCNPPWGTQVTARGLLGGTSARWWSELRRVLAPDGTAVVLIPDTGDLAGAIRRRLVPVHIQQVRLSGARSYIVRLTPQERTGRPPSRPPAQGG